MAKDKERVRHILDYSEQRLSQFSSKNPEDPNLKRLIEERAGLVNEYESVNRFLNDAIKTRDIDLKEKQESILDNISKRVEQFNDEIKSYDKTSKKLGGIKSGKMKTGLKALIGGVIVVGTLYGTSAIYHLFTTSDTKRQKETVEYLVENPEEASKVTRAGLDYSNENDTTDESAAMQKTIAELYDGYQGFKGRDTDRKQIQDKLTDLETKVEKLTSQKSTAVQGRGQNVDVRNVVNVDKDNILYKVVISAVANGEELESNSIVTRGLLNKIYDMEDQKGILFSNPNYIKTFIENINDALTKKEIFVFFGGDTNQVYDKYDDKKDVYDLAPIIKLLNDDKSDGYITSIRIQKQ